MRSCRSTPAGSCTSSPRSASVPSARSVRTSALVVEQAGVDQRLEVAQAVGREGAVDLAVAVEDAALGVTKAAWLEAGSALVSSGGRTGGAE